MSYLKSILDKPEVQKQILALSADPAYLDPQQFTSFIDTESKRWAGGRCTAEGEELT